MAIFSLSLLSSLLFFSLLFTSFLSFFLSLEVVVRNGCYIVKGENKHASARGDRGTTTGSN